MEEKQKAELYKEAKEILSEIDRLLHEAFSRARNQYAKMKIKDRSPGA